MNQTALQSHLAAIRAGAASKQAVYTQGVAVWRKARSLYISRYERSAISDFFEWIRDRHEHSIWASVMHRDGVSSVSVNDDMTTIDVESTYRCETDGDDYTFPTHWLYADDVEATLSAELDTLHAQFEAHERRQVQEAEDAARAEYEALKQRFEA